MENYNQDNYGQVRVEALSEQDIQQAQSDFVSKAYAWMAGGLLLSSLVAFYVGNSNLIYKLPNLNIVYLLALGISLFIQFKIETMKKMTAIISFIVYSILVGLTFSTIFLVYDIGSITNVFMTTTVMYGSMAAYGYYTKRDLSNWKTFLYMGFIGIFLTLIIEAFVGSLGMFSTVVSICGVIVFTGFAAYHTQNIKEMYLLQFEDNDLATKGAILGGLLLYITFVNLFIMLLRLLGSRD